MVLMFFRRLGAFFLDIIQVVIFAASIFLFVYFLILQPHKIKGNSMYPNFQNGEFLLTEKVTYRLNDPQRGDVVVFKAPTNENEEFIKRVVGLPGDRISIINNKVYINSKMLNEFYLDSELITSPGNFLDEEEEVIVPGGEYFVLGDNRPHSSDSRAWGFVKKEKITGRAWVVYWPIDKTRVVEKINYNL